MPIFVINKPLYTPKGFLHHVSFRQYAPSCQSKMNKNRYPNQVFQGVLVCLGLSNQRNLCQRCNLHRSNTLILPLIHQAFALKLALFPLHLKVLQCFLIRCFIHHPFAFIARNGGNIIKHSRNVNFVFSCFLYCICGICNELFVIFFSFAKICLR